MGDMGKYFNKDLITNSRKWGFAVVAAGLHRRIDLDLMFARWNSVIESSRFIVKFKQGFMGFKETIKEIRVWLQASSTERILSWSKYIFRPNTVDLESCINKQNCRIQKRDGRKAFAFPSSNCMIKYSIKWGKWDGKND